LRNFVFASFALNLIFYSCSQAQVPVESIQYLKLDSKHTVAILDSIGASETILHDATDGFFEKVTACEMSIQMKRHLDQSREEIYPYFLGFLQTDMANFQDTELKFLEGIITNIFKSCNEISPDIFPDTLVLIKTHSKHYGDGVWYTRENCIIIPESDITKKKTNPFTSTMMHEVFHVFSRLNPKKSDDFYKLIGFQSIGLNNLEIPQTLKDRIFHNPDGVDFAQRIFLAQKDGSTIEAIPIIYSNQLGHKDNMDDFFAYVEFSLFQIKPDGDGKWTVVTKEDGFSSTLKMDEQSDFFAQIKDNTGYIIHPDEILADNFSIMMNAKKSPALTAKFSAGGKKLISDMEALFKSK
jgi:hypothetical protein